MSEAMLTREKILKHKESAEKALERYPFNSFAAEQVALCTLALSSIAMREALTGARKLPPWEELSQENRDTIAGRAWSLGAVYEAIRAMIADGILTDKDLSTAIRKHLYIEMRKDEARRASEAYQEQGK